MDKFTWRVLVGANKTATPNIYIAKFGDGYSQRAPVGINNIDYSWSITCIASSLSEANAIEDFLIAKGGADAFLWDSPDRGEIKVYAPSWSKPTLGGDTWNITATFEQVNDL